MTRELVIISGKGGTGKTSIAASFAVLAERPVIADCDVDAADLHLVLSPQIKKGMSSAADMRPSFDKTTAAAVVHVWLIAGSTP